MIPPGEIRISVGQDPNEPARFRATAEWDDHVNRIHCRTTAVASSEEQALADLRGELDHEREHPELHWPHQGTDHVPPVEAQS